MFSPTALFLPPPPSPQASWLAPAPRASPPGLWLRWALPPPPHGKRSQASHGCHSLAQSQVDWSCAKPQNLPRLQDSASRGRSVCICRSQGPGSQGPSPWSLWGVGERSPLSFLSCEDPSFPSIAKRRKATHPLSGVPGRGQGGGGCGGGRPMWGPPRLAGVRVEAGSVALGRFSPPISVSPLPGVPYRGPPLPVANLRPP